MLAILDRFGAAVHLSVLAIAPLVLFPFFDEATIAVAVLWLSLLAALWALLNPSCKGGELPHDARARIPGEILGDPLFWVMTVLSVVAFVRFVNNGTGLTYDFSAATWSWSGAALPFLPGSVAGSGLLPFAAAVALMVLVVGIRHALDLDAIMGFLIVSSFGAGVSALVFLARLSGGDTTLAFGVECSSEMSGFLGAAFGLHALGALAALPLVSKRGRIKSSPFIVIALTGSVLGLLSFAPSITVCVFLVVLLVMAALAAFSGVRAFLVVVLAAVAVVACVFYLSRMGVPADCLALPGAEFWAVRARLAKLSLGMWLSRPWFGLGVGSFPSGLNFSATDSDWAIIPSLQTSAMNGWWQLLAERGIVGFAGVATVVGVAVADFVRQGICGGSAAFRPVVWLGAAAGAALTVTSFFDMSFLMAAALLPAVSFMVVSVRAVRMERGGLDV